MGIECVRYSRNQQDLSLALPSWNGANKALDSSNAAGENVVVSRKSLRVACTLTTTLLGLLTSPPDERLPESD